MPHSYRAGFSSPVTIEIDVPEPEPFVLPPEEPVEPEPVREPVPEPVPA